MLSPEDAAILESVVVNGDLAKLRPEQRVAYCRRALRARKVRDFLIYLAVAVPLSIAAFYALAWGLSVAPTMR